MPTSPLPSPLDSLPVRILFIEQLSSLIGKSCTTIRTFVSHAKYKNRNLIPRPFKMPGSRRLCWYEHEVLDWIESSRPAEPPPCRRPRGRPTKAEQLVRQQWASVGESAQISTPAANPTHPQVKTTRRTHAEREA